MTSRLGPVVVAAALVVTLSARTAGAAGVPVQLKAADGVPLTATLYDAENGPAVVLVHMYTRVKEDWRPFAERLQAAGARVVAVDLRGHGGSGGAAAPSAAMALDVRAAVDFAATRAGSRAVAVVGASFGATAALAAAGETAIVRGVALVSPSADYRGVRLDPALKRYGQRPLLVVASLEDPYALRTARTITAESAPARQLTTSAVAAHGSQLVDKDPDVATALVDWLRRTLLF